MGPLLIFAAFSFGISSQPVEPRLNHLDFSSSPACSSEIAKTLSTEGEERINLASTDSTQTLENKTPRFSSTFRFNPSINLKKVSWMNSSLAEQYDPRLSVRIRKAELSGFEAMVQVSIPL